MAIRPVRFQTTGSFPTSNLEKVSKKLYEEAKDRFGDFDDDEEDEG
jgi:hypothetical protein